MAERNQTVKGKDSWRKVKDCGENKGIPKQEVVFNLCKQTSLDSAETIIDSCTNECQNSTLTFIYPCPYQGYISGS